MAACSLGQPCTSISIFCPFALEMIPHSRDCAWPETTGLDGFLTSCVDVELFTMAC